LEEWVTLSPDRQYVLDDLSIPDDIKVVAVVKLSEQARAWFFRAVPALEYARPIDLVQHVAEANAVREALLRMPS
jgi:predicted ATPase